MSQEDGRKAPFATFDNKIMLSLGPLNDRTDCPYNCAHCYIHSDDFSPYGSMSPPQVIEWVGLQDSSSFDVIYISGDTDSFARPRTKQGLELLKGLTEFDVDLMFTTRYVFGEEDLKELAQIRQTLAEKGKLLFGCGSVLQLSRPDLEPKPIPSPEARIEQLARFKEIGLVSVLTMRPFLPNVPLSDYLRIVDSAAGKVDVALGEVWCADKAGVLEQRVFSKYPILGGIELNIKEEEMDFDENTALWRKYEMPEVQSAVEAHCIALGTPFFMRSRPAVEWARENFHLRG